jgi:peptidoglycan/xylan/chitin deacetylase (PgdA/CDA1 family)
MAKKFSLSAQLRTAHLLLLFFILLSVIFVSCKKNELLPKDGTITLKPNYEYGGLPDNYISLTYDDGPGPGTLELAKWLYHEHICATFFVVGQSDAGGGYKNYPLLDSLFFYGQRIGNHTYNHLDLLTLSCEEATFQIGFNQTFIDSVAHNNLCYFTPPWFDWSVPLSECIKQDIEINHLRGPIGMAFDTHDYGYRQSQSADLCANAFLNDSGNLIKFNRGEGGVIKMHDFNSYNDQYFALQETKIIVANFKARGYTFVSPTLEFSPAQSSLTTAGEFSQEQNWSDQDIKTIRLADVNGDGLADLVGRNAEGIQVALSSGLGFSPAEIWSQEFANGHSWTEADINTLSWTDVNGDHLADLIIRTRDGIRVALNNGMGFDQSTLWTNNFSDEFMPQWKIAGYHPALSFGDVNGDGLADIVVRGPEGIYVALSTTNSFMAPVVWTNDFSDKNSVEWKQEKYASTFQLADVNGDGLADLVVRGPNGLLVSLSNGNSFRRASLWSTSYSDASGWGNDESYYGAIRAGDVNGDGLADIIVRARDGMHVMLSNGHAFMQDIIWYHSSFTDRAGYKYPYYATTLQCGDINGDHRCDYILRSTDGIGGAFSP